METYLMKYSEEFVNDPDVAPDEIWHPDQHVPNYVFFKSIDARGLQHVEMFGVVIVVQSVVEAKIIARKLYGTLPQDGKLPRRVVLVDAKN